MIRDKDNQEGYHHLRQGGRSSQVVRGQKEFWWGKSPTRGKGWGGPPAGLFSQQTLEKILKLEKKLTGTTNARDIARNRNRGNEKGKPVLHELKRG